MIFNADIRHVHIVVQAHKAQIRDQRQNNYVNGIADVETFIRRSKLFFVLLLEQNCGFVMFHFAIVMLGKSRTNPLLS